MAGYRRRWLLRDLLAGLTIGAVLVPQSMAYAQLADLPAQIGLYAAILPPIAYAIFGTARHLVVGPETTTAIMFGLTVAPIAAGDPAVYASLAAQTALLVGVIALAASLLRLSVFADFFSRPVLSGYLSAVGILTITSQLPGLLGSDATGTTLTAQLRAFGDAVRHVNGADLAMGLVSLAALLILRRQWPRFPGILVVICVTTLAVHWFRLQDHGLTLVGQIPSGLPGFALPSFSMSNIGQVAPAAGAITLVAFTDNVLLGRQCATRHGEEPRVSQDLAALGIANLGAGVLGGMPGAASPSRLAIAEATGARTQLSGLLAGAIVVAALLFLMPVLELFPKAVLAAIVTAAGISLIDISGFRVLLRLDRSEFSLAVIALIAVLATDLLIGVGIAILMSLTLLLWHASRPADAVLGQLEGGRDWYSSAVHPEAITLDGLLLYRFDAPLFFANADYFRRRVLDAINAAHGVRWFVLDAEAISRVDTTALQGMRALFDQLQRVHGVRAIAFARVREELGPRLEQAGILGPSGLARNFRTIHEAVSAFQEDKPRSDKPRCAEGT